MSLRPDVLAAPSYQFSAKKAGIKLDQNESAYDLPNALKQKVVERFSQLAFNRYPEIHGHSMKESLASHFNWPETGILVSNGSNVLIQAFILAAGLQQSVLTVSPSFSVYAQQAKILGCTLLECDLNSDYSLPMKHLTDELNKGKGVFFLANPAAPTGNLFSRSDIITLAKASQERWLFVIDEAYHQFSSSDFSDLINTFKHVACLRTLSKAFGLGGTRLGFGLMDTHLASNIQKLLMPFSISSMQLAIAQTVFESPEYLDERLKETLKERNRVFQSLREMKGLIPYPSQTNFILFSVDNPNYVYHELLKAGIVIRRQDHLPNLQGCLRVTIGKPKENTAFLEALNRVMSIEVAHG